MILIRDTYIQQGIFGTLRSESDEEICKTLEHAYLTFGGKYQAKVPPGNYMCVRGIHQLSGGEPFETFEITGVEGHSGILFHAGNTNDDSSGCVLVGEEIQNSCLIRSRVAFFSFLNRLTAVESFVLNVIGG